MNIKVNGKYEKNNIDRNDNIILEIPLGTQAFSITEDNDLRLKVKIIMRKSKI